MEIYFKEFKWVWLHEKHAVATWNFGTITTFAAREGKTKKTCVKTAGRRTFSMRTSQQTEKQRKIMKLI
jgi:hypothetical protein